MKKTYNCSFCDRNAVKLWHPMNDVAPLICAKCAEKRQSALTYNEYKWSKNKREATLTGRKLPLAKWTVDEKGEVPSYAGPDANGVPFSYTSTLIVDLNDEEKVPFTPANENVAWTDLPTH